MPNRNALERLVNHWLFFRCVATWWKAWGRAQTCRWSRAPQPWQPVLGGFGNPEVLDFKEPLKKSMGISIYSNSLWLSFNIEWLMRKATMTFACFNTISAAWRASWWRPDVRNESEMRTGISMSFDLTSKCSYVHLIVKKILFDLGWQMLILQWPFEWVFNTSGSFSCARKRKFLEINVIDHNHKTLNLIKIKFDRPGGTKCRQSPSLTIFCKRVLLDRWKISEIFIHLFCFGFD